MTRRRITVLLAVAAVAALGAAGIVKLYVDSRAALVAAAQQEMRATARSAAEDVGRVFQPALLIVDRLQDLRLQDLDAAEMQRGLFAIGSYAVYSYPQIGGVYVGTEDGAFYHVTKLIPDALRAGGELGGQYDGAIRRVLTRTGSATRDSWFYQDSNKDWLVSRIAPVPSGYDPRQRPWYQAAIAAGGPVWGKPYMFASTNELGVTYAAPIEDRAGRVWGVIGVDFSLKALTDLVVDYNKRHADRGGFMFIGDEDGHLIAHALMAESGYAIPARAKGGVDETTSIQNMHLDRGDDLAVFEAARTEADAVRQTISGGRNILGIRLPIDPTLGLSEFVYLGQPLDAVVGRAIANLRRNLAILAALILIVGTVAFYAARLRHEVATRKRTEMALRESEAYTKILFQESHVPIVVMDPETHRFIDCNSAAVKIYGFARREEVIGLQAIDVSAPTQYDGSDSRNGSGRLDFVTNETGATDFEWRHQRRDGTIWDAHVRLTPFTHHGRTLFQFALEDITDRKRAEEALKRGKEMAEEATKMKSSFLAMMSHEIRTPMNGVMSMAEMLDQTDLTEDQRGMSSVIRSSAGALLAIINDILDFSKIEANKLDIESVPFSLLEVVEGAGELMAARAEDRGIDLVIDLDPALPDALVGDPARVRQILLNLIGNAIKFTESGWVAARVSCIEALADRCRLRFAVIDTGIGLTEEQRGKLFQPFAQADASTSRKYGGTGLGLSICHRLCLMMGGAIGVESVFGEGSTFWFELPFALTDPEPDRPAVAIADAPLTAVGFAGPERQALETLLRGAGIGDVLWHETMPEPDSASVGLEGRIVMIRAVPGDSRALDLTRRLGGVQRVLLAAPRGLASTIMTGAASGAFAVLTVPIRRRRLWQTIAAALGRADLAQRQAGVASEALGWMPPPIEEARAARALVLVAEDNATNQIVIRRMLEQRGYAHEIAGNGVAALRLYEKGGYGVLLTDFHMPEMDGFQLTAAIRAREAGTGQHLSIVALTADALPGTEQLCRDAGMDAYLTKPIDSRALTATLEAYLPQAAALRRRPDAAPASKPATRPREPDINPEILDLERLREAFGAIGEEAVSFLAGFLGDLPRMFESIGSALAAGDVARARHAVHALKGAARSAGANRLGQLAADIQDRLDDDDLETASLLFEAIPSIHDDLRAVFNSMGASVVP